jgi:hypothetical protein
MVGLDIVLRCRWYRFRDIYILVPQHFNGHINDYTIRLTRVIRHTPKRKNVLELDSNMLSWGRLCTSSRLFSRRLP